MDINGRYRLGGLAALGSLQDRRTWLDSLTCWRARSSVRGAWIRAFRTCGEGHNLQMLHLMFE
jgi:hypothetical protein